MISFSEIIDHYLLYVLAVFGVLTIILICLIFLKRSWARALEIGYTKEQLKGIARSVVSFSIIPSIPIVIGFFTLAAIMGIPWPWWRLSVVGSISYEIMATDIALNTAGVDLAAATATDFTLVMYVMTICILGGLVSAIFFAEKVQTGAMKLKQKDPRWGVLANSTFMLTIMTVLSIPMLLVGGVSLLTFLTSLFVTALLAIIAKKLNWLWLNNYIVALSLIIALASTVLWTAIVQ